MNTNLENCRLTVELPEEPICCIVKFRDDLVFGKDIPQNPCILMQVTLRKDKISPSKRLIRFGETNGDELMGWMRRDYLEIIEILGQTELSTGKVTPIAQAA